MEIASSVQQQMYDLNNQDAGKSIFNFTEKNIAELPKLPYGNNAFDLALCTDLIFYHHMSNEEMLSIIRELARVAAEVRIFPLLDTHGKVSDELGPLLLQLQKNNYGVEVRQVPYHTSSGANAMLRVWEHECKV
jgi:hypothetical protein